MLSEQTKELVSRFFAILGEGEDNVEQLRRKLNSYEDFDPYRLFNRLDQFRKNFINEYTLINFAQLNQIEATINQGKYVILFYDTNGDHSLNYNEFLGLVIGKGFYEKRDMENINENNSNYMSYETEKVFCELLKASFDLVNALDSVLADIKSYGDFSVSELLFQITNNGIINMNNLKNFLETYNKNLNEEQIEGLCRRLDLKKNGRIDMSDLERIFYFPYSSPPSNAASLSNSFQNNRKQVNDENNEIEEKNKLKYNQKVESELNQNNNLSNPNLKNQNINIQKGKNNPQKMQMDNKKNIQIDIPNLNPFNQNSNLNSSNFNRSNNNFNMSGSNNFNMNNNNFNMSNNFNRSNNNNNFQNSNFNMSGSTRFETSPMKQINKDIKIQERMNTDFNKYKIGNPFENKNKIKNMNIETEGNDNLRENRISKTLALRLSPLRNQQKIDGNYLDNSLGDNNNYDENQFSERDFICFLKALIDIECNIECQKCLITRHPDFNIEDIFLIFETPKTQNNILTFSDLKNGFRNLNLAFSDEDIKLLISRYDLDNNNGICYSDFFDMLVPFDKCRRDDIERRIPNGLCNSTINELRCLFQLLLNCEKNLEDIRKRIIQLKGFDLQEIYNKEVDQFGYGLANNEEVDTYLKRKGLKCNQKGYDLLFIRLDRNRDGKVGYDDFLFEITPNSK